LVLGGEIAADTIAAAPAAIAAAVAAVLRFAAAASADTKISADAETKT